MKRKSIFTLFLLLITSLSYGQISYQELWKKVTEYEKEMLPKSAMNVVENIYKKATRENNASQRIKSLLHKSKFSFHLQEDSQLYIINEFKKEIKKSTFPTNQLLENMLASMYWQYFKNNRWKIYDRTSTLKIVDENDFRTWDLNSLFKKIHASFQKSLENREKLQKIDIRTYAPILNTSENSTKYRPTLYDLLAHNALSFYTTNETNITQPAYQFKINNADLICEAPSFSKINIQTKDSLSLQFNALTLFKDLIHFHQKNKNEEALVVIDIERLKFVKENATFTNKEAIYLEVLKNSESRYNNTNAANLYTYEIAATYNHQTDKYISYKDDMYRFKNQEAIKICERIIKNNPTSFAAKKAKSLRDIILDKRLLITQEYRIPINQYSKVLVKYKNVDQLYFSIFKVSDKEFQLVNDTYDPEKKIQAITKLTPVKTWSSKLPNELDYLEHDTEIILPKLPRGMYLVLASDSKKLSKKSLFGISKMHVSNIAFLSRNQSEQTIYQVVNRTTGAPISKAKVHFKSEKQQYQKQNLDKKFVTNSNGEFSFSPDEYFRNVSVTIQHKDDFSEFGYYYIYKNYSRKNTEINETKSFLFTDRSIYRPGQTVYFKGIALTQKGQNASTVNKTSATVTLKDVNNQVITTQEFITNDFGSFSGTFILPETGLTGKFTLITEVNKSKKYNQITVEEYKRPKFETVFKPIESTYKINDTIQVHGSAKSYSGATISDAKVRYRVHRKVNYPTWCYWYYPFLETNNQEISFGETTTNNKGVFTIPFKAIPDETVSRDKLPVFSYEVTADVIDINGETRSANTTVNVGYHSMTARILSEEELNKDQKNQTLTVNTTNLNNFPVEANGVLKIYKLQAPNQVFRKRPWDAPFYQTISEKEFREKFPYEAYKNEDNFLNWNKGTPVFTTSFSSKNGTSTIQLPKLKKWTSGKYLIEVTAKDKFNAVVSDQQHITLTSTKDKLPLDNDLVRVYADKASYKPGDVATIHFASNSDDITIMAMVEKNNTVIRSYHIPLSKSYTTIKIPVSEKDYGGFAIRYYYVNHNTFESNPLYINVPYPTSDLQIVTKTFRDKLKPGDEETWSFTIKGNNKDKVTAELLASMYDASLDQFSPHSWSFYPIRKPSYYLRCTVSSQYNFETDRFSVYEYDNPSINYPNLQFDELNWFGFDFGNDSAYALNEVLITSENAEIAAPNLQADKKALAYGNLEGPVRAIASIENDDKVETETEPKNNTNTSVQIRKNLQETAFFFPHLTTDKQGNVSFNFTAPEALTRWKLQLLAHTKSLQTTTTSLETVTQKELMVVPNAPRFLRESDEITFSTKVNNLSKNKISGTCELRLTDALTGKLIHTETNNLNSVQPFSAEANGNTQVSWSIQVPTTVQAIQYQVIAKTEQFSDGEQNVLPVLSNRMLVTETLPMWVNSNQTKTFTLKKIKNSKSNSMKHHKLSLEVTSNPTWYAIQALPYLMEYPFHCAEQTFARYYANSLASFIVNSNPKIKTVFNQWKSSNALLSSLEKNQELKSVIIQETPWVRDAQSETEQKKRIALLFDLNTMKNQQRQSLLQLQNMQMRNGGFPWFKGGRYADVRITNYIVAGFGHLEKLGVYHFDKSTAEMLKKAVRYLDQQMLERYDYIIKEANRIKKEKGETASNNFLASKHVGYLDVTYLYMRSFYTNIPLHGRTQKAVRYYTEQAATYWTHFNNIGKGYIALAQNRGGHTEVAQRILKSLKETSITSEELGMYWKKNTAGWYWHQAPIETQALLIEAFSEINDDIATVDNLKKWLLKNKQVNRWKTTKATSEAVYALLLRGSNWLESSDLVTIEIGNETINPTTSETTKAEAGTGYFKTTWTRNEISPEKATVTLTKKDNGIAWGGLYWQYFEDLDKISAAKTPLKLSKQLFKKVNSDRGKQLIPLAKTTLEVGDLVTVRIELRTDRSMEFIHMKDLRASAFEPIDVISHYKWQDNLGYYQSTKDAATHFFFDRIPKGVYVFEYDVRVNNKGNFSTGITSIQSMYAPEFSSHSKGSRIQIK